MSGIHLLLSSVGSGILVSAFFHRGVLSLVLLGMAMWGWLGSASLPGASEGFDRWLRGVWVLLCSLTAVFPLLPTIGRGSNIALAVFGPACLAAASLEAERRSGGWGFWRVPRLRYVLLFNLTLACLLVITKGSLPHFLQAPAQGLSWTIAASAPLLPLMSRTKLGARLEALFLGVLGPYTLMSLSFETLFLILLVLLLAIWIVFEARVIWLGDWRRAYFFLFFLLLSFFGTGNIASLNSFDPSFTRCFTTVFDPFLMGALLLGKVVVPFVLVCAALVALERVLNQPPTLILLPLLIFADFMALGFFFLLKDSGSWLEIGTSISHYVIALGVTLFAILLTRIARLALGLRLSIPRNLGIDAD